MMVERKERVRAARIDREPCEVGMSKEEKEGKKEGETKKKSQWGSVDAMQTFPRRISKSSDPRRVSLCEGSTGSRTHRPMQEGISIAILLTMAEGMDPLREILTM